MVFSSILFLFYFLPAILFLYFLFPEKYRNAVLLTASLLFYTWGAPKFIPILLTTTIIDFYIVENINKSKSEQKRKILLAVSLTITVVILAYFKYANFFLENFNSFLQNLGFSSVKWTKIALPIGISFFSFQKLTYAVDVYQHKHKPFKSLSHYLLFIVMFPQLIAGPIIRFHDIADQIESRKYSLNNIYDGFIRFVIGLAKKVLIANTLSIYADIVFDGNIIDLNSTEAWVGLLAYTFQIYFDFAGYSDMAIGIGRMLGFKFPENFNSPYISQSITEFWRRWHITLGTWMKDYLYIPLGGNRVNKKSRLYFNLIFVFFISGLWHGAAWNFVIWGLYHGTFLILDRIFLLKILKKLPKIISILFTFLISILGWVIFRIEDFGRIKQFFLKLFSFKTGIINYGNITELIFILLIAAFFSFITISKPGKRLENYFYGNHPVIKGKNFVFFFTGIFLLIFSISNITASGFNPFIYFHF